MRRSAKVVTMIEQNPAEDAISPEKQKPTVVKVVFTLIYDTKLAGHDPSDHVDHTYVVHYPSGLDIGLLQDEDGQWGRWYYQADSTKCWEVVPIPEDAPVKELQVDGVFHEQLILSERWYGEHQETDSQQFYDYMEAGIRDFLIRTGQQDRIPLYFRQSASS